MYIRLHQEHSVSKEMIMMFGGLEEILNNTAINAAEVSESSDNVFFTLQLITASAENSSMMTDELTAVIHEVKAS